MDCFPVLAAVGLSVSGARWRWAPASMCASFPAAGWHGCADGMLTFWPYRVWDDPSRGLSAAPYPKSTSETRDAGSHATVVRRHRRRALAGRRIGQNEPPPRPRASDPARRPARPMALRPAAGAWLKKLIEAERAETLEWLRTKPTSYLATVQRRDFENRRSLTVGRAPDWERR